MKKMLLVSLGLLLCFAGSALAGNNAGAQAYLSFSATTQLTDAAASALNNLFVRYVRTSAPLEFKGGEIDLTWDPASDGAGCFDKLSQLYKTATTCTYLNRGLAVPVVTIDDPNHLHVAWANNSTLTGCTAGAGLQIQFQTDGCADPTGCFSLNQALILDSQNVVDATPVASGICTIGGGGSHHCGVTAAEPKSWGTLKSLYRK